MSTTTAEGDNRPAGSPENPSRSLAGQIEAGSKECPSCRIIGTGAFAGLGIYSLMQSRATAPGTPLQKRIMGGMGIAMLIGSVVRWYK